MYNVLNILGKGAFGKVYLAKPLITSKNSKDKYVAIKSINKEKLLKQKDSLASLISEIRIHWSLDKCDSFLKLLRIFENDKNVFLILEY